MLVTALVMAVLAQSAAPRVLISADHKTGEFDPRGTLRRYLMSHREPWVRFGVSADLQLLAYIRSQCEPGTGQVALVDVRSGAERFLTTGSPLYYRDSEPGIVEAYADPAVSPKGDRVAFAVRRCSPTRRLDLVESAGPVAIWSSKTNRAEVFEPTINVDGVGPVFANDLTWSPDGLRLLVNFETGFAVFVVDGGIVEYVHQDEASPINSWTHALGWVGPRCVAFVKGDPTTALNRSSPMVVKLRTREIRPLASLVGMRMNALHGLLQIAYPYFLVANQGVLSVVGPSGSTNVRPSLGAEARMVQSAVTGPSWCAEQAAEKPPRE